MAAQNVGYFTFSADICVKYSHNADDFGKRVDSSTMCRSNPSLFIGCIQESVYQAMDDSFVIMEDNIAFIGYCSGTEQ